MIRHKKIYPSVTPLNPPELAGRRKRREIAGERPLDEQTAYLDRSQVGAAEPLTDTDIYEAELPAGEVDDLIDDDNVLAVASDVAGVAEVIDGLHVRSLGAGAR